MILIQYMILNLEFRKNWLGLVDIIICQWNRISFSLLPTLEPLPVFSVRPDASGAIGYGAFMGKNDSKVGGQLPNFLWPLLARNFFLLSWQPMFGIPVGPAGISCFMTIMKLLFAFLTHGYLQTQTLCNCCIAYSKLQPASVLRFLQFMFQEEITAYTVADPFSIVSLLLASLFRPFILKCHMLEDSSPHPSSALSPGFHSNFEARCLSLMYQGLAALMHCTYSCAQDKFVNFCIMFGHLNLYGSPYPASERTLYLFAM